MITLEELELLDEPTRNKIIRELQTGENVKQELQTFMQNVYKSPALKQKLEEVVKAVSPNIKLPDNPLDPIYNELNQLKQQQQTETLKQKLMIKAQQLNITPAEYTDVDKFMQENGITNMERGMELYAQLRNMNAPIKNSILPLDYIQQTLNPSKDVYDLNAGKQHAVEELQRMKFGGR